MDLYIFAGIVVGVIVVASILAYFLRRSDKKDTKYDYYVPTTIPSSRKEHIPPHRVNLIAPQVPASYEPPVPYVSPRAKKRVEDDYPVYIAPVIIDTSSDDDYRRRSDDESLSSAVSSLWSDSDSSSSSSSSSDYSSSSSDSGSSYDGGGGDSGGGGAGGDW